jgi:hypothetical protein
MPFSKIVFMQLRSVFLSVSFISSVITIALWLSTCKLLARPAHGLEETARVIVENTWKPGHVDEGVAYGDAIIPALRKESGDFSDLNIVAAESIGRILSRMESDLSLNTAAELYSRENQYAKLCGALALACHHRLKDTSYLIMVVSNEKNGDDLVQLATQVLGEIGDKSATPCLLVLLKKRDVNYCIHRNACQALGKLQDPSAQGTLRTCMRDPTFDAFPECFRALIAIGDRDAVHLGIERLDPAERGDNSCFLVRDLQRVTGKHFGFNRSRWEKWWSAVKDTWALPVTKQ